MSAALLRKLIPERWRPIGYLTHLTRERTGCRVASGPFAGMHYIQSAYFSAYIPKLLGIYERELTASVEDACAARPDRVIDVGAAEGYFAVGLARRNPQARIIAFEMAADGRALLDEMATRNGVRERMDLRGRCEPADLQAALLGAANPLVVCDVESYEMTLLDPAAVPALAGARVLVELHDFMQRGIGEALEARFAPTHRVTRIWQEDRPREEFPYTTLYTRCLPVSYLDWAVSEWRPERMSWLYLEPLDAPAVSPPTP